ncbi:TVP38/TMEM64 family protein [Marinobacter orientalis]|uniref:TVP38/TMEM64 family membrane protein n=1 Tax=Marinobacter orientalis TaxID=1928859 RepID=A0A7Y0NIN1_9GAMM|nr:TVP38/TMEM64 family protein [Marinobacter orientalis]NMT62002.1 TVP38/TMEM64 family protein [Marinobacter orientalis]TGX50730.1 TVP38/TMEM64 family protein [Marinobacter orientalis]
MQEAELERKAGWKSSPILGMLASIAFVGVILAVLYSLGIHEQVVALLQWFEAQGAWAALLFILLMTVTVAALLPGFLFTTGAGFVFGVVEGTIYVVTGTVLGASLAFLIARYLFGDRAKEFVMARARLRLMSEELTPHGWKIVLLTRLIPFFPGKLSNYFFGLTRFSFRGFVGGSVIGFIPFSLHNVYLGSIAADLTVLGVRETGRSPLEWAIYGAGFAGTLAAVIYLNILSRRALAKYTDEEHTLEIKQ